MILPSTFPTAYIKKILKNLDPNKAFGPDKIRGKILKNCAKQLSSIHPSCSIIASLLLHLLDSKQLEGCQRCPGVQKGV
jgi:hypothetical protein